MRRRLNMALSECTHCVVAFPSLSNDLRSRLRGDLPSSDTDVKHLLSMVESDALRCDAELERLSVQVLRLQNARQRIQQREAACVSLLAPIRKVPVDILTNILAQSSTTNELWQKKGVNRSGLVPSTIILSGVCASWRKLTHSTPSLWANFSIVSSPKIKNTGHLLHLLKLYLKHSHQYPLSFRISCSNPPKSIHTHADVYTLLCQHAERWRAITLDTDNKSLQQESFLDIQGRLPLLEEIAILNTGNSSNFEPFSVCPSLRKFKSSAMVETINIPWAQIEELVLYAQSAVTAAECCVRCPQLTSLELSTTHTSKINRIREELPFVTSLKLMLPPQESHDNQTLLANTFKQFALPALESLIICGEGNLAHSWSPHTFRSFLKASACSIISLTLDTVGINSSELIEILSDLPSLTNLVIIDQCIINKGDEAKNQAKSLAPQLFDHEVLRALTYDELRPCLVPQLTGLTVSAHGSAFKDEDFVSMVLSRYDLGGNAVKTLRTVNLTVDCDVNESVYKPLVLLKRYGLNAQIW